MGLKDPGLTHPTNHDVLIKQLRQTINTLTERVGDLEYKLAALENLTINVTKIMSTIRK